MAELSTGDKELDKMLDLGAAQPADQGPAKLVPDSGSVMVPENRRPSALNQGLTALSLGLPGVQGEMIRQAVPKLTGQKPYLNPTGATIATQGLASFVPGGQNPLVNFGLGELANQAAKVANEYVFKSTEPRTSNQVAREIVDNVKFGLPTQVIVGAAGTQAGKLFRKSVGGADMPQALKAFDELGIEPSAGAVAGEGSLVQAAEHVTRGLPRVQLAHKVPDATRLKQTVKALDDQLETQGISRLTPQGGATKTRAFRDSYDAGIDQFAEQQRGAIGNALPKNFKVDLSPVANLQPEVRAALKLDPETAALMQKADEAGWELPWADSTRLLTLIGRSTRGGADATAKENRKIVYRALNDSFDASMSKPNLPLDAWKGHQAVLAKRYEYLNTLDEMLGDSKSSGLISQLQSKSKEGDAALKALFKDMPTGVRNDVRGAMIERLGSGGGKEFNPNQFAKSWKDNLSPEAKAQILPDPLARDGMNKYADTVLRQGEAAKKSSAGALWVNSAIIAALTGGTAYGAMATDQDLGTTIAASAAAGTSPVLAAKLFASPVFARWLGTAARATNTNALEAAISRLATLPLKSEDERGFVAKLYHKYFDDKASGKIK